MGYLRTLLSQSCFGAKASYVHLRWRTSRIFSRIHCLLPFTILLFQFIAQCLGPLSFPYRSQVRQTDGLECSCWGSGSLRPVLPVEQTNPFFILSPTKEAALTCFSLALNSQALFFLRFFSTFLIPNSAKELISPLALQRFLPDFKLAIQSPCLPLLYFLSFFLTQV